MPTIKKLQETWTSSSITTLFRLCSQVEIDTSLPLQSPVAGLNWYLILRALPSPRGGGTKAKISGKGRINKESQESGPLIPTCQLLFYSSNCPSAWRGAPVKVTLSFPSHPDDGHVRDPPLSSTLGGDTCLLITRSIGDLGDALVSLEVAFTYVPTNLFDELAHAGPVSCAPASAKESSVPQARTGLRALEGSLKTGTSFDIVFQVYTRRLSPGKVARPIPIYASTTVLQETTLLLDFSEEDLGIPSLFELPEDHTAPFTSPESYEYESDSDLDDEEGNILPAVPPAEELRTRDEVSACHDQLSDTQGHDAQQHEDATDSRSISSFSSFEARFQEQSNNRTSHLKEAETVLIESIKSGSRVVLVKGVAWNTWRAFVYYCYTGIVNFSSLRSQALAKETLQQGPFKDGPPHCSPKSMYQLAMKLHNDSLSQLALNAIETRLSAANILEEAFSKFTARHDAIREMEIAFLVKHKSEPDVLQGLPAKIKAMAMGNIPHAEPVLTALYQRIVQTPSQTSLAANVRSGWLQ